MEKKTCNRQFAKSSIATKGCIFEGSVMTTQMTHFYSILLISFLFFSSLTGCKKDPSRDIPLQNGYEHYDFGDKNTIIFATQPLAVPTGVIPELLGHDIILREELSKSGRLMHILSFYKGKDINKYLFSGEIDVAVAGDMPVLTAAGRQKVIVVALAKQSYSSIVARRSFLINELKGKKVGIALGSTSHYVLLQALEAAGLDESDVKIVPMNVDKMAEALAKGKIDAFAAWEPTPTIALQENNSFKSIHKTLSTSYLFFSREFAENNREEALTILAAYIRAIGWMRNDRDNLYKACELTLRTAEQFSGTTSKIPIFSYEKLVISDLLSLSATADIPWNDFEKNGRIYTEFKFLVEQNKISGDVSWETIKNAFTDDFMNDVVNNPQKYRFNEYQYEF